MKAISDVEYEGKRTMGQNQGGVEAKGGRKYRPNEYRVLVDRIIGGNGCLEGSDWLIEG